MPTGEALDGDYIIALLKRDADEHRKRFSGTPDTSSTLHPASKRRADAPKPNTRFLKNIIRDTDSHNAALKAKEEGESKARLRELKKDVRKREREEDEGRESAKRREEGVRPDRWARALGGLESSSKRSQRSSSDRVAEKSTKRDRPTDKPIDRPGRWASALGDLGAGRTSAEKKDRTEDGKSSRRSARHGDDDSERSRRHRHERDRDRNSRDRHHKRDTQKRRASSERSTSPRHRKDRRRRRSPSISPQRRRTKADDSDSDPLTACLGPLPKQEPLPRGRGALKDSKIDSRFEGSYDPKTDVAPDAAGDDDDWDMALEALRARTKWKAQGAERLRAAGFTEEEVGRWEDGGEKREEDVNWRKKGEGREWDRGKVLGEEGAVEFKTEWAR